MKPILTISIIASVTIFAGCQTTVKEKEPLEVHKGKTLLTVDFQQGQVLRYKFTSSRDIEINWDPGKKNTRPGKTTVDKSSESMEMVVAYTPIEVDPFGISAIKAICETVKIKRSKGSQGDAVESVQGKNFTFTVSPTGKIEDYSQLENLIRQVGEKAFRPDTDRGRIKEPDMIGDFVAGQWFLWDSISSIEKVTEGVSESQNWRSKLPVPGPMVMRKAREVTYKLDKIRQSEKGRLAVISSTYSPTETVPEDWPPMPYSGRFQMSGTFGFLRGYQVLDLQGRGEELFNIDAGQIEQYDQQYQVRLKAFIPMGLDVQPQITMNQNFTMQLIE